MSLISMHPFAFTVARRAFDKLSQNSAPRCSCSSDSVLPAQIQTFFDLRRQPLQHIQLFIALPVCARISGD
jgi:hypothetical protein